MRGLAAELEEAYRPSELRAVQCRLRALGREEGIPRAAKILRVHPQRLGRLRGVGALRVGTRSRTKAVEAAQRDAQRLAGLEELRRRRRYYRKRMPRALTTYSREVAGWKEVHRVLRGLPSKAVLQKELARLAFKAGMKVLELVLPKKLVIPIKAGLRAVEMLRERGVGRGR